MGTPFERVTQYPNLTPPEQTPRKQRTSRTFILLAGFIFILMALHWADVVEWKGGQLQLKKIREAQLERDLKEIDEAEQYALLAMEPGFYPCALCPSKKIFLKKGEVWKYGVTRKGQQLRYSDKFLQRNSLYYYVEFIGHYAACLAMEKIKLYNYPLLPENANRPDSLKLILPPGNKQLK